MQEDVTFKINNSISHHFVESLSVLIVGVIAFTSLATISYMINDLVPPYKVDEGWVKTWLLIFTELTITIVIFHQANRIFSSTAQSIFANYKQVRLMLELNLAILSTFAISTFQSSLKIRTRAAWISFFGKTNEVSSTINQSHLTNSTNLDKTKNVISDSEKKKLFSSL